MSIQGTPTKLGSAAWAALLIALAAAALHAPLDAQRKKKNRIPRYKQDPYTKGDPKLMKALGYVSYGPMPFGTRGSDTVTSADIEKHLNYAEFIWVETAHFRIGMNLPSYAIPEEASTKKKIRAELTRLKEKLPRIKPKTRRMDRWLRLHLTAQRLETLYADFQARLGVKDSDFPKSQADVVVGRGRYMGYGPYLGQRDKYLLLLCEKQSTYLDYLKNFIGKTTALGQRWNFKGVGSLFYGLAIENEPKLKHDTGLHNDLIFNQIHSLLDGFRHYSYDLPVWITEGLAHWWERQNDPRWNTFSQSEGGVADTRTTWKWRAYMRGLFSKNKFSSFATVYKWRDYTDLEFDDHVGVWSRWDFLMSQGDEKLREFLFAIKGRVKPQDWSTDQSDLIGATRDALRKAYNLTPLNFDDKWKAWVLENYPSK